MAKKKPHKMKKGSEPRRGLDSKHFKGALEAVQALVQAGKLLVMSDFTGSVRFVVDDVQDFANEYRKKPSAKRMDDKEAREVLEELRGFFQLALFTQREEQRFKVLEEQFYPGSKKLLPNQKGREHRVWREKFEIVEQHRIYRGLSEREKRLQAATAPCIVDVDAELVRTRRIALRNRQIDVPFLRVCLRYGRQGELAFPFTNLRFHPWDDMTGVLQAKTFEFECDKSDIDLLIRRLLAAKLLLAHESEPAK